MTSAMVPGLSEEQRRMVESVRRLAQERFRGRAEQWLDGTFPWVNIRELAEIGILGMAVPEEYGGLGLAVFDTALVLEEIAKVCYPTAMAVLGEVGVQTRILTHYAPEGFRRRILPRVVSGDAILAIAMTEPDAGTDVANYRTSVAVEADRLVLNGTKTLISRADEAAAFVIFARIDRKPGREGIGCVLLERDTPGFSVAARYHTMGGENLADIRFENCALPLENLAIREDGFRKLLNAFNTQRCLNPAISLGLAEGAFDEAVKYTRARTVFGTRIADFQGQQWKLADMYMQIEAARGLLYRACASATPFPDPFLAATAKVFCNEMALKVTSDAVQMHGGYGFTDAFPVSRLYRGARYGTLGGGASETLRDLIGKRIVANQDDTDGIASLNRL